MEVTLSPSTRKGKKWVVKSKSPRMTVHFGQKGASDYTIHKDKKRKELYIARHDTGRENWTRTGLNTPGFWSRWLLWNKPSLEAAKKDIEERFGVSFAN